MPESVTEPRPSVSIATSSDVEEPMCEGSKFAYLIDFGITSSVEQKASVYLLGRPGQTCKLS